MALQFRDVNVLSQDQAHWFLSVPFDKVPLHLENFFLKKFTGKDRDIDERARLNVLSRRTILIFGPRGR